MSPVKAAYRIVSTYPLVLTRRIVTSYHLKKKRHETWHDLQSSAYVSVALLPAETIQSGIFLCILSLVIFLAFSVSVKVVFWFHNLWLTSRARSWNSLWCRTPSWTRKFDSGVGSNATFCEARLSIYKLPLSSAWTECRNKSDPHFYCIQGRLCRFACSSWRCANSDWSERRCSFRTVHLTVYRAK